jgi:hypothetical protein
VIGGGHRHNVNLRDTQRLLSLPALLLSEHFLVVFGFFTSTSIFGWRFMFIDLSPTLVVLFKKRWYLLIRFCVSKIQLMRVGVRI